jgi:hypothetical protein
MAVRQEGNSVPAKEATDRVGCFVSLLLSLQNTWTATATASAA